jgi:hypothetical protein
MADYTWRIWHYPNGGLPCISLYEGPDPAAALASAAGVGRCVIGVVRDTDGRYCHGKTVALNRALARRTRV